MLLFFVLALNIQIFVEGLSCTPSIPTISYVSSCPKNKEDWEAAAKRKKCDTIVQSCTASIQFQYHCLINQWLNATLEVCAPTYYLQGYCASYSIQRKQIVENYEEGYECLNYGGSDKCPRRYLSNEAYKYQPCYTFVSKHETKTTAPTTAATAATTLAKEPRSDDNDNSVVGIAVGIVLVLVVLGLVILICWFRQTIYSKLCKREEGDLEEVQHEAKKLLDTGEKNTEVGNLEEEQDKENLPLNTGKTNTGTEIQVPDSGETPKAERVNVDIKETSDIEEEKEAKKAERCSEITDRSLDKDKNETGADIETMDKIHKPSTDKKQEEGNDKLNLRNEDKISVERQEDTSTDKNLRKEDKLAVERQEDTPVDKSEVAKELEKKENTSTIMKIQEGGDKLEKDDNVERHDDTSMSKNSRNEDKVAVDRQEDTSTDKNLKKEDKLAKERQEDTPVHIDKNIQEGDDKLAIQSKDITGNIEDSTDSEKDDKVAVKKQEDTSRSKTIEGKEVTNNIQDSTVRTTDTTEEVSVDLEKDDKVEGEIQEDTLRSKINAAIKGKEVIDNIQESTVQTKDIIEDVSTEIQEGDDKLDTEKDDKVEEERQEDTSRSKNLKKEDKVPVQKQEDISLDKNVRKEDKEAIERQEDTCMDKTVESKEDTSNIQDSTAHAKDITEGTSLGVVTKEGERKEKTSIEINFEKEKDKVVVESQENTSWSKVQTKDTIEDTPIEIESEEINIQGSVVQNNDTTEDASIGIRTEPKEKNEKTSTDINQEKDLKGQDTEVMRPLMKSFKKRAPPVPPGTFPKEAVVKKLTEPDRNIMKERKIAPPRPAAGPMKTAYVKSTDADKTDKTDNDSIPQQKRRAPDPPPQNTKL